jgi:hypothetical protein
MPDHHHPADDRSAQPDYTGMRRVVIEERQQKMLEHLRASTGYADDVSRHAHNAQTFPAHQPAQGARQALSKPTTSSRSWTSGSTGAR